MSAFCVTVTLTGVLLLLPVARTAGGHDTVCDSEFNDVASSTILSPVVFEGRVQRVVYITGESGGDGGLAPATVVVVRPVSVFKGSTTDLQSAGETDVRVGYFDVTEDATRCVAQLPSLNINYVIFARSTRDVTTAGGGDGGTVHGVLYRLTALPVRSTRRILATVREFSDCSRRCGRPPTVRLLPALTELRSQHGQRLELRCQIRRGRPLPRVDWFRDGVRLLDRTNRVRLTSRKKTSKLRIKRLRGEDGGSYSCRAVNIVGQSANSSIDVIVVAADAEPTKTHSEICSEHSFCLNGGTCFILLSLSRRYCVCSEGFRGSRCQERDLDVISQPVPQPSKLGLRTFEAVLVICGVVASAVVLVAIAIIVYASARRCAVEHAGWRRRQQLTDSQRLLTDVTIMPQKQEPSVGVEAYQQTLQLNTDANDNISVEPQCRRSNGRLPQTSSSRLSLPRRSRLQAASATLDSDELNNAGQLVFCPSDDVVVHGRPPAAVCSNRTNHDTELVEKETTC